jgi:hypothetical protein
MVRVIDQQERQLNQIMTTPGGVKDEPPIVAASNSKNKSKNRISIAHGDIFAEQLGVTLSLTFNSLTREGKRIPRRPMMNHLGIFYAIRAHIQYSVVKVRLCHTTRHRSGLAG